MATAQLSTFNHGESHTASPGDSVCVASAMFGAASGALAGATVVGGAFEYSAVLIGTLGVVMGSIIAGTAGRYLITPMWKVLAYRRI